MFDWIAPVDYLISLLQELVNEIESMAAGLSEQIALSPADMFGTVWQTTMKICSTALMPLAICIVGFLLCSELYNLYCKNNGKLDIELICVTAIKFILPFLLMTHVYDFVNVIFQLFSNVTTWIGKGIVNSYSANVDITALTDSISKMGTFERIGMWLELVIIKWGFRLMWIMAQIIVFGRLFHMALLWLFAPIPCATALHSEHSQIFKNYIKTFAALVLQGALIVVCCGLYAGLVSTGFIGNSAGMQYGGWILLLYSVILIFTLFRTEKIAKRLLNTF